VARASTFDYLWGLFHRTLPAAPMTRTIALLVFSGVQALDVTGPMDVFAEANRFVPADERYEIEVIGIDRNASLITCCNGLVLQPHCRFDEIDPATARYDLILATGGAGLQGAPWEPEFYEWLRRVCSASRRYGSICNGAFVLAHAGLLEERTVTTHWHAAAALAELCPTTHVEPDRIFVRDDNLYTSAGVTAGIDLSLYLVAQDHGREIGLQVAKRLVVFTQRSGGQSQFSPYLTPLSEPASTVTMVQKYVQAHLAENLSVSVLANVANLSVRNFTRVFTREAKMAPAGFVESARVDAARALLESSGAPLKRIADRCGFKDTHNMRQAFKRRFGVTPQQYRANFSTADSTNITHDTGPPI